MCVRLVYLFHFLLVNFHALVLTENRVGALGVIEVENRFWVCNFRDEKFLTRIDFERGGMMYVCLNRRVC